MENNILCKNLNKTMPDIEFKVRKNDNSKEAIFGEIRKSDSRMFSLRIYIEEKHVIRMYFDFGKIKFNEKALFFLNRFNANCPVDFISYINCEEDSFNSYGYLHILITIRENNAIKAAELIDAAINKLLSRSMEKLVYPLTALLFGDGLPNLNKMN